MSTINSKQVAKDIAKLATSARDAAGRAVSATQFAIAHNVIIQGDLKFDEVFVTNAVKSQVGTKADILLPGVDQESVDSIALEASNMMLSETISGLERVTNG